MRTRIALALIAALVAANPRTLLADEPMQQAKTFEKDVVAHVRLDYLLFLPEGYAQSGREYPLILFLHGAGESGSDVNRVKKHGMAKILEAKKDFPCIVVSPQSPRRGWNVDALNALLDQVVIDYRVDRDRIYLTGLSMGGYGTWALAASRPDRFAAIAPICGGGDPKDAPKLKDLPIWVFHGAKDPTVPLSQSEQMVEALKAAGSSVKFTVYPDAVHDSWTQTYDDPEFFRWLLAQKRPPSRP